MAWPTRALVGFVGTQVDGRVTAAHDDARCANVEIDERVTILESSSPSTGRGMPSAEAEARARTRWESIVIHPRGTVVELR